MNARTTIAVWAGLLAAAAATAWWFAAQPEPALQFRTARLERGDITATVSASGTITPVATVQVGSQVSGQIREVLADFNSPVKAGQVIARIDPETFEYRVSQAQADLEAARAQVFVQRSQVSARRAEGSRAQVNLDESRRDAQRKEELLARSFIAQAERDRAVALVRVQEEELKTAQAALEVAQAQVSNSEAVVRQREAALSAAKVDVARSLIRSPVDGVVIKRSVEAGQTVAASLTAPELFIIARNLRDMQVDTSVDETDIGRIRVGQPASFAVDAYPGRSFEGRVAQLRMAALNVQNVITYTVVVRFSNADGKLLPGMTANVRIVSETRKGVLKAPNAALRARVPAHALQAAAATAGAVSTSGSAAGTAAAPGSAPNSASPAPNPMDDPAPPVAAGSGLGRVYVLQDGKPRAVDVRTGISDGAWTEVSAGELAEGNELVIGTITPADGRSGALRLL
ncbi:MAG: HlyD family secretion protein [Burkholderiales bacterium]|nr:HlyD family secretion protein [Burkholderiales bacterium]